MLHSSAEQAEKERILLSSVFGDSDSESETDADAGVNTLSPIVHVDHIWERIEKVPGLWLCKGFLNDFQQEQLLAAINAEGWFGDNFHNQAMRFGELPWWALEVSNLIYSTTRSYVLETEHLSLDPSSQDVTSDLPLSLQVLWRLPLFDQMIANCYQPGEVCCAFLELLSYGKFFWADRLQNSLNYFYGQGICPHVDLLQFEDGIAIISLESTCVMHFTHVGPSCQMTLSRNESKHLYDHQAEHTFARSKDSDSKEESLTTKIPILLKPGDLVLISGEARYNWKHEINRSERCQLWNGEKITQKRRISVTLRKLILSQ